MNVEILSVLSRADWLNILNVFGVLLAASFAALSAKYAKDSVSEQRQHDNPQVVVFIEQHPNNIHIVNFVIKNEGIRSARDLTFKVHGKNIGVLHDRKLKDTEIIKFGVKLLAGGNEIKQPLTVLLGKSFDEYKKAKTEVEVRYRDNGGTEFANTYTLGFRGLVDIQIGGDQMKKGVSALQDMSKEIGKIRSDIHSIANQGMVGLTAERHYRDDTFSVDRLDGKQK